MKVDPGNGVNFLIMRTFQTLFILLALCGCGRRQPAPETVRPVKVVTASGAGVIDKDFAGMATPDDAVNLAFKLSGQVLDVPVSQGENVKKGALLAELDPATSSCGLRRPLRIRRGPLAAAAHARLLEHEPSRSRNSKLPEPAMRRPALLMTTPSICSRRPSSGRLSPASSNANTSIITNGCRPDRPSCAS